MPNVIVVGAGSADLCAALAATRQGAQEAAISGARQGA